MTTRGSLARGQGQQQFQGNVQKWVRQWVEPGTGPGSSKVALLKWVPTGDRSGSKPGPRFPHLQPVNNVNFKIPAGNKDNGKKPVPRQPVLSQPAAMDIDGGQQVHADELQQEGTLSADLNASRAVETNGEPHTALQQQVKQGATELPDQVSLATSQHAPGTIENKAVPDAGRSLADGAAEPIRTSSSHADTAQPGTSAAAVDLAPHQPAPASQSHPDTPQPAAELQSQQEKAHGSTQQLKDASAAERGGDADGKLSLPASLGDEAPGQAPAGRDDTVLTGRQAPGQATAGRDDEALTGQEAPDLAMAAGLDGTLAGDKARSGGGDEALTGPQMPSGAADEAPLSTAAETAASAAALEGAVQLQQPEGGAQSGPLSLDAQPEVHSEPAVAALTSAKRPAEDANEGIELDAKRARIGTGVEHST